MILPLAISAYLIGMIVFLLKGLFHIDGWVYAYFSWEKAFGAGFITWYIISKYGNNRKVVLPIVWLAFIRFIWEVVCWIFSLDFNNKWGVLALFMLFTLTASYACLQKDSRLSIFLDKYTP